MNNNIDKNLYKLVYVSIVSAIVLAYLIASFGIYQVYDVDLDYLKEHVSKIDIDNAPLSISKYSIDQNEEKAIDKIQGQDGQIYYIHLNYEKIVVLGVMGLVVIVVLSTMVVSLLDYYNREKIASALKPVEKMAKVITDILSGTSSEGDPEAVFNQIRPLFQDDGVKKDQLEESIKNLIEAEKNRREFTANVTHELKTPLTSINGYAEMIASGIVSQEDVKKFSQIILSEGNRLLALINEIIQLSKYDSGDRDLINFEQFDLSRLANTIVKDMRNYALSKEINLQFKGGPVVVYADKKMMDELITNLISNASKYNYPGGNVFVSVEDGGDTARIIVKDDGIGISERDQERIFERFYMVNRSGRNHSGTGLGLSLVKHIVKNHNGTIDLESSLGKGSTFTITIPKEQEEEVIEEVEFEDEELEDKTSKKDKKGKKHKKDNKK